LKNIAEGVGSQQIVLFYLFPRLKNQDAKIEDFLSLKEKA